MLKQAIEKIVLSAVSKAGYKMDAVEVFYPEEDKFGDFSTNVALKLAKEVGKNPKEVAEKIAAEVKNGVIENVEIAGPGFINIFVASKFWQNALSEIIKQDKNYGRENIGKGKKVNVEYISANPTGPMHLGHARNGFVGDALANVFDFLGYDTTREFYVNDGGNQITMLGNSMLKAAGFEVLGGDNLYGGGYIEEWAKKNKKFIKENQANPKKIGKKAASEILNQVIKNTVKKMGIKFDVWFSEDSLYKKKEIEKSLAFLERKGLIYEKDSAVWFKASQFGDTEDRVIIKSDGLYTYIVPDIAYHYDKFAVRKFSRAINILGTDHHGYVPRLFAAISAMGYGGKLDVILMQLVRLVKGGKEFKMSKRAGLYVTVDDLFDLIGGVDAPDVARFFFLSSAVSTHMDFDLDLAKERSEKNPVFYVKYAHARLAGILRKSKIPAQPAGGKNQKSKNLKLLTQPEEIALIKILSQLPEVVEEILEDNKYSVHRLTHYSIEIARKLHSFYDKCRVIDEKNLELTAARLELVKAAKIVLNIVGEDLIGIKMPEKM